MKAQALNTSQRNRTLDLLKGILIIFVITLHFPFPDGFRERALFPYWVSFAVPAFLFISGYVSSLSAGRAGGGLKELYDPKRLLAKCVRFLIPYTIYFIFMQVIFRVTGLYKVGIVEYGLKALFFDYLRGTAGPGSYYVPLMIEFVFVFPLIYLLVNAKGFRGVLYTFGINVAYEVVKEAFGMGETEYRLLVFRYLFIIACGAYACIHGRKPQAAVESKAAESRDRSSGRTFGILNTVLMVMCTAAGAAFVYLFSYTSYESKIITYWRPTSVFAVLFIVPVMFLIVTRVNIRFAPLELVGKASFNIFLVQMIFYIYYERLKVGSLPVGAAYAVSVCGCVAAGILFYLAENRPTKALAKLIVKSPR